jgi:hypothetical protein
LKSRIRARLIGYFPEYINGTLGSSQKWILERWLTTDAEAREELLQLQIMRSMVRGQSQINPSPSIYKKIVTAEHSAAVRRTSTWRPSLIWVPIVLLLILAGILLWHVLPPGLVVQWSVQGKAPATFRVYRAPAESSEIDDFTLIGELAAESGVVDYGFTDLRLIPGQSFSYRVEAISDVGQLAASQAMVGDSLDALPGQLLLILIAAATLLGLLSAARQYRYSSRSVGRMALI